MDEKEEYYQDSFIEAEEQKETEEDLFELSNEAIRQSVVSGTDWTTETILNQINKGNILLNPAFQRRDAWTKKRKSKFIESLFLGLPIPQVVLAQSKDNRGKYIVLDGKQRLLSIRQFSSPKDDNLYDQLKLSGLEVRNDLNGKSFEDLQNDLDFYSDISAFENQPIRTIIIKNWPNETFLYHVFLRLNTGSVSLSPQELRQALHPGEFVRYVDETSRDSKALQDILGKKSPDFRMRDAELLVRYYSFKYFLAEYKGNLKEFLDNTCENLNNQWDEKKDQIENHFSEFENAHWSIREIFKENAYRKWNGDVFEKRFNRAIFDIMIYAFSNPRARVVLRDNATIIPDIFMDLCQYDADFLSSIEQTTKSIFSTSTRLTKWCDRLNREFQLEIRVPRLG